MFVLSHWVCEEVQFWFVLTENSIDICAASWLSCTLYNSYVFQKSKIQWGVKQYWYNRATSNTFHLNALSLYSRLMLPNKRAKYMCSWKGAHLKRGVCWSIMKIVWHYSNCSEALYLYLPDNAMFTWLCTLWEQRLAGNFFLCGLNGLVKDKEKKIGGIDWLRADLILWYD